MTSRSSVFQLGILNWRIRCGLVWITFHSMWGNLSPRLSCCRHKRHHRTFCAQKQRKAVLTSPTWAEWGVKYYTLCKVFEATPLSLTNPAPFHSYFSTLCTLSDTSTNIIPARGGNSFLTRMMKIFLKSMIMTSCRMGSKHNYCCSCKGFLLLYFYRTVRNWIVFGMEEVVDSL